MKHAACAVRCWLLLRWDAVLVACMHGLRTSPMAYYTSVWYGSWKKNAFQGSDSGQYAFRAALSQLTNRCVLYCFPKSMLWTRNLILFLYFGQDSYPLFPGCVYRPCKLFSVVTRKWMTEFLPLFLTSKGFFTNATGWRSLGRKRS